MYTYRTNKETVIIAGKKVYTDSRTRILKLNFKRILLFSYEFSKNGYRIVQKRFEVPKFFVGTD